MVAKINVTRLKAAMMKTVKMETYQSNLADYFNIYIMKDGHCFVFAKLDSDKIKLIKKDNRISITSFKKAFFVEYDQYALNVRKINKDNVEVITFESKYPDEAQKRFEGISKIVNDCCEYVTNEEYIEEITRLFQLS